MALQKFPLLGLLMLLTIVVSQATADGPVCPSSTKLSRASFPEGFIFGTATAAYQNKNETNFEWNEGYKSRFGLYYIDFKNNLTRIEKESGKYYKDFLSQGVRPSAIKRDEL